MKGILACKKTPGDKQELSRPTTKPQQKYGNKRKQKEKKQERKEKLKIKEKEPTTSVTNIISYMTISGASST